MQSRFVARLTSVKAASCGCAACCVQLRNWCAERGGTYEIDAQVRLNNLAAADTMAAVRHPGLW